MVDIETWACMELVDPAIDDVPIDDHTNFEDKSDTFNDHTKSKSAYKMIYMAATKLHEEPKQWTMELDVEEKHAAATAPHKEPEDWAMESDDEELHVALIAPPEESKDWATELDNEEQLAYTLREEADEPVYIYAF